MTKRIVALMMVTAFIVWNNGFPVNGGDVPEGVAIEIQDLAFIPGFWHVSFEPDVHDYTVRVGDYMPKSQIVQVTVASDLNHMNLTVNGLTMTPKVEEEQVLEGSTLFVSEPIPMTMGNNLVVVKASLEEQTLVYTYKAFYMSSSSNPVKDDNDVKHNKKVPQVVLDKEADAGSQAKYESTKNEVTQGEEKGSPALVGKTTEPAPPKEEVEESKAPEDKGDGPGASNGQGDDPKGPGKGKGN